MRSTGVMLLVACGGGRAGSDAALDAPASNRQTGRVRIFEETAPGLGPLTFEAAGFHDASAVTGSRDRIDGACAIRFAADAGALESAGTVSVTHGLETITLSPDGSNLYPVRMQSGLHYAPGDVLAIAGAGATVPGFSGGLTFPSPITVTSPGFPPMIKNGFTVSWTGSSPVSVQIGQTGYVAIQCDYASTQTAAIPASALSDLIPGTMASMQISLSVAARAVTPVTAGAYDLELEASRADFTAIGFAQ